MKGFLKGIRYITQIFESDSEDEEEEEMQIGAPTDVKHVAHIGCDGPSVSSPSWMTDLKSEAKPASKPSNNDGEDKTTSRAPKGASQELKEENGTDKSISSTRGEGDIGQSKDQQLPEVPKRSRRRRSNHSSLDSTEFNDMSSETVVSKKSSRRHHSSDLSTMGGGGGGGGGGSTKPSRRNQNLSTGDANGLGHVVDTPSPLLPKSSTARNKKKSHQ